MSNYLDLPGPGDTPPPRQWPEYWCVDCDRAVEPERWELDDDAPVRCEECGFLAIRND